ncbi:MAG TPA: outer membrane protein assembly factor BamD [Alphaproteobacteria bacterium]|nr:outer membrane protein assembly factor BamD [Alphaproteobacteria bacterium]
MKSRPDSTLLRSAILLALTLVVAACSGDNDKDKLPPDQPVAVLYDKATKLMGAHEYADASKAFEEVERQHPYSPWATRAQLMEAYADYQGLAYDAALATLETYIELHPGNKDIAYAYYLRALCYYERIADVERDQTDTRGALKALQDVASRYPGTVYARDAKLKIALVNDHLAGYNMSIGRWYLGQHLYIAAIGRFKTVIKDYQTTSYAPEALERLVECYLALGIPSEAKATAAVLGYNFPGSKWYEDAYALLKAKHLEPEKNDKSWIAGVWDTVF